jgi:hypothetical protein
MLNEKPENTDKQGEIVTNMITSVEYNALLVMQFSTVYRTLIVHLILISSFVFSLRSALLVPIKPEGRRFHVFMRFIDNKLI